MYIVAVCIYIVLLLLLLFENDNKSFRWKTYFEQGSVFPENREVCSFWIVLCEFLKKKKRPDSVLKLLFLNTFQNGHDCRRDTFFCYPLSATDIIFYI